MSKATRRAFLKNSVLGTVGAGLALTALRPEDLLADPQLRSDSRSYAAGKYALELDGVTAGWLNSVEGGHATSDVVNEKLGGNSLQKKHIGGVKYEDITLDCGAGMSKAFYDWISANIGHQNLRKNGAILVCDYNYKEMSRLEWNNGLITEVVFPAADAASKDAAKMSIKISPEFTREAKGMGGATKAPSSKEQKRWLPSNFKLEIPTLDCTQVSRIEAITVKQNVAKNSVGEIRNSQKEPANVQTPNLVISVPESHAKGFYDWHEQFVIKGQQSAGDKSGKLHYLTPDLREPMFTLNLQHVGIFKITPEKSGARHVKVEMYWQDIRFISGPAAWA